MKDFTLTIFLYANMSIGCFLIGLAIPYQIFYNEMVISYYLISMLALIGFTLSNVAMLVVMICKLRLDSLESEINGDS